MLFKPLQLPVNSDFTLILVLFFTVFTVTSTFLQCEVAAQLITPVARQEINVGSRDGIQVNSSADSQTRADYRDKLDNSSDIQKVTYFSDGKTLNVTMWLGDNIPKNPTREGANNLVYGILIDVDN